MVVVGKPLVVFLAAMDPNIEGKLLQMTAFSKEELDAMYNNFKKLSATRKSDGVIDKQEFRLMLNASATMNSAFLDALFKLFDRDNNGSIDFGEFVLALAIYQNKARAIPEEEKHKLFFKLYDVDGDGEISQKDLSTILSACFGATHMAVGTEEIDALVRTTFSKYQLTSRGTIDFASYSKCAFRLQ
jgi:Ca2+-binding EF-hand superfamily protein